MRVPCHFFALLLTLLPFCAGAETLDDAGIRKAFAEQVDSIRDPEKILALMETRLDKDYVVNVDTKRTLPDGQTQATHESVNRAQFIANAKESFRTTTIKDYSSSIQNIQYSSDKKEAYVTSTEHLTGEVGVHFEDGKHGKATAVSVTTCVETLVLRDAILRTLHSQCSNEEKISLARLQ